jgi:RimJ/RimL family protein N-acetyltransferase
MLIRLIPFTEIDIPNLIRWVDAPGSSDLWASRTYRYPLSAETVANHIKKADRSPKELSVFKIVSDGHLEPLGHVELDKFDHHSQSVRITRLFIDPKFRGRGAARRATELLLQHCFEDLSLNRVEILAVETNLSALKLYKKMGFREEGFLRENMILSGKRLGSHFLSMLRTEYSGFDRQPILKGALVKIRPLLASDFDALYLVAADPLLWEQHPQKDRYKRETFEKFFADAIASRGALLVCDNKNETVIGTSRFYEYSPTQREVIIGYTFLARSNWGGAYNSELKKLMLDHAFRFVDTVLFHIGEQNLRSRRAVEKIGAGLRQKFEKQLPNSIAVTCEYTVSPHSRLV